MRSAFVKRFTKITALMLALLTVILACVSCAGEGGGKKPEKHIDYAASVKLDMSSNTLKQEVTVHAYIDGDTTHFNVPETVMPGGVLKARYLAINTPESTGKIEPWGKTASNYTKEPLRTRPRSFLKVMTVSGTQTRRAADISFGSGIRPLEATTTVTLISRSFSSVLQ